MTQLKSSDQAVVRDSHKSSLIFLFFHAEVWSPKEASLASVSVLTRQASLCPCSQGTATAGGQERTGSHLPPGLCQEHCSLPPHPLLLASLMLIVRVSVIRYYLHLEAPFSLSWVGFLLRAPRHCPGQHHTRR